MVRELVKEKEHSEFKPVKLRLKTDLVSYPARVEGLSKYESIDFAPCDFCLFPKLRSCRYETIEKIKEAVTKVTDTLAQEDFHGAFQKLLEMYNKCIVSGADYFL